MFKNANLARINELENKLEELELLISDAWFFNDYENGEYYSRLYNEVEEELNNLRQHHKESLQSDYELVYSC